MFTGIIEEVGAVERVQRGADSAVLRIKAKTVLGDIHLGDSIAVNGVCLTVTAFDSGGFSADVMHETLDRSALALAKHGTPVNLERAMAANGRFGGHIVAGHVDGTGTLERTRRDGNAVWYDFAAAPGILRYVVEKGSIAIDGVSLTVARVDERGFSISAIPHTLVNTALQFKRPGDKVNLETDIIGKYVEKLMQPAQEPEAASEGITLEMLLQNGF